MINAAPRINGAVFWPANGFRNWENGVVIAIGSEGIYWVSTAYTSDQGHRLQFISTTIIPQESNPRDYAFPVRCIRD